MKGASTKGKGQEAIRVLDFGGQYSHLICRRFRQAGFFAELVPYNISASRLARNGTKGIVLSGGPASVYQKGAPKCHPNVLELAIPVLGICYGHQLIAHLLGGEVAYSDAREYGGAELTIDEARGIFEGLGRSIKCWMSHGDKVDEPPPSFTAIAHTKNSRIAAMRDSSGRVFGVQFHPEVAHTPKGLKVIENFASKVCGMTRNWTMTSFVDKTMKEIAHKVRDEDERVVCAVSGGVDSTTTAALIHKAVGDRLLSIFVNHGLLRKNEAEDVTDILTRMGLKVHYVDASSRFLARLKGVVDPEEKRKIVGEEFIKVFTEESLKHGKFEWLAQGTLYPDVIESAKSGSIASRIKTHHNVAGLPETLGFKLLEPMRELYKDEVREVARVLKLPDEVIRRHPFPGPGLAVRVIGEATPEKLEIARDSGHIVEEELKRAGLYDKTWQAFAFVGDDKAVGVLGDERKYGYIVTVRVVTSVDAMTADWMRIPFDILGRISRRITNEVKGVTMVTYSVSSKPPSTIEPQ